MELTNLPLLQLVVVIALLLGHDIFQILFALHQFGEQLIHLPGLYYKCARVESLADALSCGCQSRTVVHEGRALQK